MQTMIEAAREVLAGVRPSLRGVGYATIYTTTGDAWVLMDEEHPPVVERIWHEGETLHRQFRYVWSVTDKVVRIQWSTDESGAIKGVPGE